MDPVDARIPLSDKRVVNRNDVWFDPLSYQAEPEPAEGVGVSFGCAGVSLPARPTATAPGTVFAWKVDDEHGCLVLSRIGGGQVQPLVVIPMGTGYGPRQTNVLSPDGTRVAWVTNDSTETMAGDLAVVTVGGTPRLLGGRTSFSGARVTWESDSRHLVVYTRDDAAYRVDTESGASSLIDLPHFYPAVSANGRYRAEEDAGLAS